MTSMLVYVTAKDQQEALRIARAVVQEKLAACANILGTVTSVYVWNGQLQEEAETSMILKTDAAHFERLEKRVSELHSYSTPCIIGWELDQGNKAYLAWLKDQLS